MSDTRRRAHTPLKYSLSRGGQRKARSATEEFRRESAGLMHSKPHKQRRPNERIILKREWL